MQDTDRVFDCLQTYGTLRQEEIEENCGLSSQAVGVALVELIESGFVLPFCCEGGWSEPSFLIFYSVIPEMIELEDEEDLGE